MSSHTSFSKVLAATLAGPYVSIADQGIASVSNFLPIIALARFSTASELGIYSVVFTIIVFLSGFEHALITAPYTFYRDDKAADADACYSGSVLIHHAAFVTATSAALLLAGVVVYHGSGAWGMPVIFAAVVASTSLLSREFIRRFCFASRHFGIVLLLDVCAALLQISSVLLLATSHALTATSVLYAVGCSTAPFLVWGTLTSPRYRYQLPAAIRILKKHWSFGKWIVLGTSVSAMPRQLFPWCLALFHGSAAAGMLAACTGILQAANPGLIGFANYFGPVAARVRRETGDLGLHRVLRNASIALAIFLAFFCLMVFALGSHLLALVYGPSFAVSSSVRTLSLLSLALLLYESTLPLGLAFMAMDCPRANVIGSLAGLCVTTTIGLAAVKLIGIEGVGVGLLLAGCAESAVKVTLYARSRSLQKGPLHQGLASPRATAGARLAPSEPA